MTTLRTLLTWFIRPHARITDPESRQMARLLAGIQIVTIIVGGFIIGYVIYLDPRDLSRPDTQAGIVFVAVNFGLYTVTRLGYVRLSAALYILMTLLTFVIPPYMGGAGPEFLAFAIVPVLLTAVFFRLRWVFVATVVLTGSVLLLNQLFRPNIDYWSHQFLWYFQLFASTLIITVSGHLNTIEDIRLGKLRESEVTLERRVIERTTELQAAVDQVQALNRVQTEFVSNVSHELRTPITNIKLHQQLLEHEVGGESSARFQTLYREIDRLETLIESLLLLSRLDQNQVYFDFDRIDLNELVAEYVTDRALLAEERHLTLRAHMASEAILTRADRNLLGQVISILLTNAMTYTPAGGEIDLRSRRSSKSGGVHLEISDTGDGIPLQEQDRLFERFFRGTSAHQTKASGTGLGLAIAREIVERHDGHIEVQSTGIRGEGTTFTVWLPSLERE